MSRFDWAEDLELHIEDWTEADWDEFRAIFNTTPREKKEEILKLLRDETAGAQTRKSVLDWVEAVVRLAIMSGIA